MGIFCVVNKLIEEEGIEFIVMGMKGRIVDENILMGSIIFKMINKIKGSFLLIVLSIFKFEVFLRIGFVIDFSFLVYF